MRQKKQTNIAQFQLHFQYDIWVLSHWHLYFRWSDPKWRVRNTCEIALRCMHWHIGLVKAMQCITARETNRIKIQCLHCLCGICPCFHIIVHFIDWDISINDHIQWSSIVSLSWFSFTASSRVTGKICSPFVVQLCLILCLVSVLFFVNSVIAFWALFETS